MPWVGSYEELEEYLRRLVHFGGDPAPYDFEGVLYLMLALLDNLHRNALEGELRQLSQSLTEEQAAFVRKLAESLPEEGPPDESPGPA